MIFRSLIDKLIKAFDRMLKNNQRRTLMSKKIAISSGHGKIVRGANGIIDEVDEARRITDNVAEILRKKGATVAVFHDNESRNANTNLAAIVNWHRQQDGEIDVLVHFNAFDNPNAHGTEVICHADGVNTALANRIAEATASAGGFRLRPAQGGAALPGVALRDNLFVINQLRIKPCVLLEVCFVTSPVDVSLYAKNFNSICEAIAGALLA